MIPSWARRWLWKWANRALVVGIFAGALTRAGWVQPMLGTLESVARASEATSVAAGAIATAGANVTVSLANFAVEAVGSSLTLSEELWRGIDLRHVNVTRTIGRVAAPDSKLLELWIHDGGNGLVPPDCASRMASAVRNLSVARPLAEVSQEFFSSDGTWQAWAIKAKALPSGYVGAVITTVRADFAVEWANPIWEVFGVDPHREAERIATSIRRVVATLEAPPPAALDISDAALGTAAMPVLHRVETSKRDWGPYVLAMSIVVATWVHRPRAAIPAEQAENWDVFEDPAVSVVAEWTVADNPVASGTPVAAVVEVLGAAASSSTSSSAPTSPLNSDGVQPQHRPSHAIANALNHYIGNPH